MLILYSATIFLGALLLFLVQPMVGRMLLPRLGGAPAVWNTAMVFYQATLLAGYAYAHFAPRWLGPRRQRILHLLVLVLPAVVLPIAIPRDWTPPATANPALWVLGVLTMAVGLPLFVVATTSSLLQRWFAGSSHARAGDPYFLYAASNAGSLLALVAYPVIIEPRFRLAEQSVGWTAGYALLAVLVAVCSWRAAAGPPASATPARPAVASLPAARRGRWVLLAFVPCSLMLSVTTYVTSEVAPVPLLWVIPLGIYLLTFILVFAKRRLVPHAWMVRAFPFAVLLLIVLLVRTLAAESFASLGWPVAMHFAGLFVVAMMCHGELVNDRPAAEHLTEFYLWISVGGVLGGAFNALLAPAVFPTVLEYPVTLLIACLLLPRRDIQPDTRQIRALDFALPAALGLGAVVLIRLLVRQPIGTPGHVLAVAYGLPALVCVWFARRPLRFALGVLAFFLATTSATRTGIRTPVVARSFFGIHRVELFPGQEHVHILRHGTTMHGMQSLAPRLRRLPLLYFTKAGPLGQAMNALPADLKQHVAVVGLGAGTLACYADAGQNWTFYEIDPIVERIARDERYFTYLQDCPATLQVVLGDARLSLQTAADGQFGLIVSDAYNSDTIPLHLVTREALALFTRKLTPRGVLLFHITNRHLNLVPVFANLARDAGLFALCQRDPSSLEEFENSGKMQSCWVAMTRDPSQLAPLTATGRWQPPAPQDGVGLWTDDYASVFRVFSWQNID